MGDSKEKKNSDVEELQRIVNEASASEMADIVNSVPEDPKQDHGPINLAVSGIAREYINENRNISPKDLYLKVAFDIWNHPWNKTSKIFTPKEVNEILGEIDKRRYQFHQK